MDVVVCSLTFLVLSAEPAFLSLYAPLGRILSWFHKLPKKGTRRVALGCVCHVCPELLSVTAQAVAFRSGQYDRFYEYEFFTKSLASQMEFNLEMPAKEMKYSVTFFLVH